ncbi:class I SAM-dependent methyltransferase [candidate division KSB1 bacterium]|nr:class I SAM-dependent methyltransferase [candidate division KSB1 bacterium]
MQAQFSESVWQSFACPDCNRPLTKKAYGALCDFCQLEYRFNENGALDLRLQRDKHYQLDLVLAKQALSDQTVKFIPTLTKKSAAIDFSKVKNPWNLSPELMSYIPQARRRDRRVLDLGCGSTLHRGLCETAGYEYVGLDYFTPEAPILGDAHALPFANDSFEFIISINVLEHCHNPFVTMREAYRVLEPGGTFLGVVSFLEPYHDHSYFHHTFLGICHALQVGGFEVEFITPSSKQWTVLRAMMFMGFFPKMPNFISKTLVWPLMVLHRCWWSVGSLFWGKSKAAFRSQKFAGSLAFLAHKRK